MSGHHFDLAAFSRGCIERRKSDAKLQEAWQIVCQEFSDIIDPRTVDAGYVIAQSMNAFAAKIGREPRYHNRHHTIDVIFALTNILRLAIQRSLITRTELNYALIAMMGHDILHDGTLNTKSKSLEHIASAEIRRLLAVSEFSAEDLDKISELIHKTDPAYQFPMRIKLRKGEAENYKPLELMIGDSDLFASLLPDIGQRLSDDLSEEWMLSGLDIEHMPNTVQGRKNFLSAVDPLSEPATDLGLARQIKFQLDRISNDTYSDLAS